MFNEEVRRMLAEVISSWQVIAVTIVFIIYVSIVRSVAKTYRSGRVSIPKMPKKPKKQESPVTTDSDDLNLEEEYLEE